MPANGNVSRLLNALRRAVQGSRGWAWLAAVVVAATAAAYLTAAAAPARPARDADAVTQPLSCGPSGYIIQCYSPGQFRVAYGVAPLLRGGITGSGETVVMPELANAPGPNYTDIRQDLAAFDRKFGLPASYQTGAYHGEMAWNADTNVSAGGYSVLFRRPAYQDGIPGTGATRGVPDVAANADSSAAMALTFTGGVLIPAQGTSAATPLWAAVIALADQEAGRHLGFVNPAIYRIARSGAFRSALHDVVTGDNSVFWPTGVFVGYKAGRGWDPVTGWGSPDAHVLVPLLARTAR